MEAGHYISVTAHAGFIALLLFGDMPSSKPPPIDVGNVTTISSEDFAALMQTNDASVLDPPVAEEPIPSVIRPPLSEPVAPALETPVPPEPQAPPVEDVPDVAGVPDAPDVPDVPQIFVPPVVEITPPAPTISRRPKMRPAPRIASVPVAPSEPETPVDDVAREATTDTGEQSNTPEVDATAPEEAAVETVLESAEADETSRAPTRSARPRGRPANRPNPSNTTQADAITAALNEAVDTPTPRAVAPSGPPMTGGEKDAFKIGVAACWNVGSLSSAALRSIVVVGFSLREDGKPITASIRMLSSIGSDATAARQAFESARRAIIRCGARGYNLPIEKYDHWREVEMTFNPEKMRIK